MISPPSLLEHLLKSLLKLMKPYITTERNEFKKMTFVEAATIKPQTCVKNSNTVQS